MRLIIYYKATVIFIQKYFNFPAKSQQIANVIIS